MGNCWESAGAPKQSLRIIETVEKGRFPTKHPLIGKSLGIDDKSRIWWENVGEALFVAKIPNLDNPSVAIGNP